MKPQDFFLGVRDFFAVFIPGLVLLMVFPIIGRQLKLRLDQALPGLAEAGFAFAAFLTAYALGVLVSGFASRLDGPLDSWLRTRRKNAEKADIAVKTRPGWRFTRKEHSLARAERLAGDLEARIIPAVKGLKSDDRPWSVKGFWWTFLRLNCSIAAEQLDAIEGYQKLFRSLIVVAPVAAAAAFYESIGGTSQETLLLGFACLAATGLFAFLYASFRIRFTRRLYELAIVYCLPDEQESEARQGFYASSNPWAAKSRGGSQSGPAHQTSGASL